MLCGGLSQAKEADASVQSVCNQVRAELEQRVGRSFDVYTATHYTTQLVAGTNYFIKVHVGNDEYVHLRVYEPLPGQGQISLHSHQLPKKKDDELVHFE